MSKRKGISAEELLRQLAQDPEYQAALEAQERARLQQELIWAKAEAPLVEELRQVGVEVTSVWDLVNTSKGYPSAVPVLGAHLTRDYPDKMLEGIGRALAVPEARSVWDTLLEMFSRLPDRAGGGSKAGVACALAEAADDSVMADVISLVQDTRHGDYRNFLLSALRRSRRADALEVLQAAAEDASLAHEARRLLKRKSRPPRRARQTSGKEVSRLKH